ncbi:MAG TPA: hypothetical protein PK431_11600 [Chitinophagales bacterium]|nr:hypothetical protein [Chitinophagales bacterium]
MDTPTSKYQINEDYLISLGFKKTELSEDEEIDDRGWLFYDEHSKLGFQLVYIPEREFLWVEMFHGENEIEKRSWQKVLSKTIINNDTDLRFIFTHVLQFRKLFMVLAQKKGIYDMSIEFIKSFDITLSLPDAQNFGLKIAW